MRKVLLRIVFDQYWQMESVGNELLVGAGWVLAAWTLIAVVGLAVLWKLTRDSGQVLSSLLFWAIIPTAIVMIPVLGLPLAKSGVPLFGYGLMLFVGFASGTLLATRRARQVGLDPNVVWDLTMWLLIPGIIGARVIYLLQNWQRVVGGKAGMDAVLATVNLTDGGIVFYGCVIGGVIGAITFCRRRNIRILQLGDVVIPSLMLGLGFGRIGCFLYGCCFGGPCSLPWAVRFPPDSLTFQKLVERGTIPPDAAATIPLHPTQIYSSILAFSLAAFLTWYFRHRPFEGAVLALGCTIYPINRFVLEVIRDDEPARMGTGLTFSQLMSIGIFLTGCGMLIWLSHRHRGEHSAAGATKAGAG
ncbi:MAG: prolipoprotein diacylglyceryl transferase [Planctomycetaceae bacterium]